MRLRRSDELSLGDARLRVSTELRGADEETPRIVTAIYRGEELVSETASDVADLRPVFRHSIEILRRIDAQHARALEALRKGEAPVGPGAEASPPRIETVLEHLRAGRIDEAEAVLDALRRSGEAMRELAELSDALGRVRAGGADDDTASLRAGAEAYVAGRRDEAIEQWKRCLAREPSEPIHGLLVLYGATTDPTRRRRLVQEILAVASRWLAGDRSDDAQALLLVAQSEDRPAESVEEDDRTVLVGPPALDEEATVLEPPAFRGDASEQPSPAGAGDDTTVYVAPAPTEPDPRAPERAAATTGRTSDTNPIERREAARLRSQAADEAGIATPSPSPGAPPSPSSVAPPAAPPSPPPAGTGAATPDARTTEPRRGARRPPAREGRGLSAPAVLAAAGALGVLALAGLAWLWLSGGPARPVEELEAADALLNTGRAEEARAAYAAILAAHDDWAPPYVGRGRARLSLGDIEGGLADLRRALELDPTNAATAEELADVLYSQERCDEAAEAYLRALGAAALQAESRYRLASCLVRLGREDEAMEHLAAAVESDPAHGEAHFLYGTLLGRAGRYAEAEKELRAAASTVGSSAEYYARLGEALLEQGKLDEAEELSRRFAREYPEDARAYALLGDIDYRRGQFTAARDQLFRALRLNDAEPRARLVLGRTWLAIARMSGDPGDLAKARQILAPAVGVDEAARLLTLGEIATEEGDLAGAVALLERAAEAGADPRATAVALARAHVLANDLAAAAGDLERARTAAPGDAAIALALAVVYGELGDARRATEAYLEALQAVGMTRPASGANGPVALPAPPIPLPERFDIDRALRAAYEAVLRDVEDDPAALALKELVESTSFVLGAR